MTMLEPTALVVIRREHENHLTIVARQKAGMKRHYEELERAYYSAVQALGAVLDHVAAQDNQDASDVAYAGLGYVYKRERWHEKPHDSEAFSEMSEAYDHLRDTCGEYSVMVAEETA